MIKSNPLRYVIFPLATFGLFLSLIYIQFTGKSSISHPFGSYIITGAAPSAPGSDGVSDFNLSGLGINFTFRGNSPIMIRTADNTDRNLRAKSYSLKDRSLLIEFQYNLKLRFGLEEKDSLTLDVLIPPELEGSRLLRIPFQAPDLLVDTSGLNLPVAEFRSGNQRSFLILKGAGDSINASRGYLELNALGPQIRGFTIIPATSQYLHAADYWLGSFSNQLDGQIDQVRNAAYQGWRFSRRRGIEGWTTDTEAPRKDWRIFTALMVESVGRDQLLQVWGELGGNTNFWRTEKNLDSAAFTGDIVQSWRQRKASLETVLSQILQGNWSSFNDDPTLLRDFYFLAEADVFQAVWERFKNVQPQSAEEAIARLENLALLRGVQVQTQLAETANASARAALSWLTLGPNSSLLVKNNRGLLDYALSLRLGTQLYNLNTPNPNGRTFKEVGSAILSKLFNQAQGGLLPGVLIPLENDFRAEGKTGFEEVARFLFPSTHWPKFITLPSLPGGKAFIRSNVSISVDANSIRIQSTQPPGLPQHFVIHGVPAFEFVTLHGIRWRSDPSFQSYSDGWLYDEATKTFYGKLTNRFNVSELVINIGATNQ